MFGLKRIYSDLFSSLEWMGSDTWLVLTHTQTKTDLFLRLSAYRTTKGVGQTYRWAAVHRHPPPLWLADWLLHKTSPALMWLHSAVESQWIIGCWGFKWVLPSQASCVHNCYTFGNWSTKTTTYPQNRVLISGSAALQSHYTSELLCCITWLLVELVLWIHVSLFCNYCILWL